MRTVWIMGGLTVATLAFVSWLMFHMGKPFAGTMGVMFAVMTTALIIFTTWHQRSLKRKALAALRNNFELSALDRNPNG